VKTPSSTEKSACCGAGKLQLTAARRVTWISGFAGSFVERNKVSEKQPSLRGLKEIERSDELPAGMGKGDAGIEKAESGSSEGVTKRSSSTPWFVMVRVKLLLTESTPKSTRRSIAMMGAGLMGAKALEPIVENGEANGISRMDASEI